MTDILATLTLIVFFIMACLILPLTLTLIVWIKYRIISAPEFKLKFPRLRLSRPAINLPQIHISMGNGHNEDKHLCNYSIRYTGDYERLYCQCEKWVQARIKIPTNGNGQYELLFMPAVTNKRNDNDRDIRAEAYQHPTKGKSSKGKQQQHRKGKGGNKGSISNGKTGKGKLSFVGKGEKSNDGTISVPDSRVSLSKGDNVRIGKQYIHTMTEPTSKGNTVTLTLEDSTIIDSLSDVITILKVAA